MRARSYEVWFRSTDLDQPTVLLGRFEARGLAEKITMMFSTCVTEGTCFLTYNDETPEPS
jgi:hypothetical protein